MRLNKYLSIVGIASRRKADEIIKSGKVSVNGKPITEMGYDVDEKNDVVFVNGKKVDFVNDFIYLMMYKPKGTITSLTDDKGRKTVMDYVPEKYKKFVKPVGRLDYDSEGLLLLTNDGDFANKVTHPSSGIKKTYQLKIEGTITPNEIKELKKGVKFENEIYTPLSVKITEQQEKFTKLEVIITEGKNREVRNMFLAIGKTVTFLKRTQIGMLRLGGMSRGATKTFNPKYVITK